MDKIEKITIIALVLLFVTIASLAVGLPTKNRTIYYEIPQWGKFVCVKNTEWFGKNPTSECWLLTTDNKMVEFIDTWNRNKK